MKADDQLSCGFNVEPDSQRAGIIRLFDSDGFGEPENVITFGRRCAEAFDLSGRGGFV